MSDLLFCNGCETREGCRSVGYCQLRSGTKEPDAELVAENESLRRTLAEAIAVNARLRLLENVDILEGAALGTFLKGGDIPNTVEAARVALVKRALESENRLRAIVKANTFAWEQRKAGFGGDIYWQALDSHIDEAEEYLKGSK